MRLLLTTFLLMSVSTVTLAQHSADNAHDRSRANSMFLAGKNKQPRFSIIGELQKGQTTPYSVNGVDFTIASDALILGSLKTGQTVKVRGIVTDGKKIAKKILSDVDASPARVEENKKALF